MARARAALSCADIVFHFLSCVSAITEASVSCLSGVDGEESSVEHGYHDGLDSDTLDWGG